MYSCFKAGLPFPFAGILPAIMLLENNFASRLDLPYQSI